MSSIRVKFLLQIQRRIHFYVFSGKISQIIGCGPPFFGIGVLRLGNSGSATES